LARTPRISGIASMVRIMMRLPARWRIARRVEKHCRQCQSCPVGVIESAVRGNAVDLAVLQLSINDSEKPVYFPLRRRVAFEPVVS
jgi:hypothetical protein